MHVLLTSSNVTSVTSPVEPFWPLLEFCRELEFLRSKIQTLYLRNLDETIHQRFKVIEFIEVNCNHTGAV